MLAYSTLADLIHHSRELLEQLSHVIYAYSCNVRMMSVPCATQTLSMKLLLNLIDQVLARCIRAEAACILMSMLETGIDKLGILHRSYQDFMRITDDTKPPGGDKSSVFSSVARSKPVEVIAYLVENPEWC